MAKWLIEAQKTTTFNIVIEAENPQEASRIAEDTHLNDWVVEGSNGLVITGIYHG